MSERKIERIQNEVEKSLDQMRDRYQAQGDVSTDEEIAALFYLKRDVVEDCSAVVKAVYFERSVRTDGERVKLT